MENMPTSTVLEHLLDHRDQVLLAREVVALVPGAQKNVEQQIILVNNYVYMVHEKKVLSHEAYCDALRACVAANDFTSLALQSISLLESEIKGSGAGPNNERAVFRGKRSAMESEELRGKAPVRSLGVPTDRRTPEWVTNMETAMRGDDQHAAMTLDEICHGLVGDADTVQSDPVILKISDATRRGEGKVL